MRPHHFMTMKPTLDASHIYRLDGRARDSVSRVLDLFFPPTPFYTEEGRDLGTVRHLWFHALVRGQVMENEPDPRIGGAVIGFRKFMADVQPLYVTGEESFHDPVLDVCGTPDLVAEIGGRLAVVDYKPPTKNKRTLVQTAAYSLMLRANRFPILDRYELRLGNGIYRLDKHRDADDEKRWPVMVAAFRAASHYRG